MSNVFGKEIELPQMKLKHITIPRWNTKKSFLHVAEEFSRAF